MRAIYWGFGVPQKSGMGQHSKMGFECFGGKKTWVVGGGISSMRKKKQWGKTQRLSGFGVFWLGGFF